MTLIKSFHLKALVHNTLSLIFNINILSIKYRADKPFLIIEKSFGKVICLSLMLSLIDRGTFVIFTFFRLVM